MTVMLTMSYFLCSSEKRGNPEALATQTTTRGHSRSKTGSLLSS